MSKAKPAKAALARKKPNSYRSSFERAGKDFMESNGISFGYETSILPYTIPSAKRKYYPDFDVGGVHYEFKGRWIYPDRRKMLLVKEANPKAKVVMVFMRPENKIAPKSKTTYGEWCSDMGIEWLTYPEWQDRMLQLKAEGKL